MCKTIFERKPENHSWLFLQNSNRRASLRNVRWFTPRAGYDRLILSQIQCEESFLVIFFEQPKKAWSIQVPFALLVIYAKWQPQRRLLELRFWNKILLLCCYRLDPLCGSCIICCIGVLLCYFYRILHVLIYIIVNKNMHMFINFWRTTVSSVTLFKAKWNDFMALGACTSVSCIMALGSRRETISPS